MDAKALLVEWNKGLRIGHIAHSQAAVSYKRRSRVLGVPATVFSVVVGTSIFATLGEANVRWILICLGVISLLNAVLTGLQTWLNYAELAERHGWAAIQFGGLRRDLEQVRTRTLPAAELDKEMTRVRVAWQSLDDQAPGVPQRIQSRAEAKAGGSSVTIPN